MRKNLVRNILGCSVAIMSLGIFVGCQTSNNAPTTQYEVEADGPNLDITIDWSQFESGKQPSGENKTSGNSSKETTKKGNKETTKKGSKETTTKKGQVVTSEQETTTKKGTQTTTSKTEKQTTTKKSESQTTTKRTETQTTTKKTETQTTTKQQETTQQYTTEEFVVFDHYEIETNANHEGGKYAVYSNGTKELLQEIVWRKDLATSLFSRIAPLREAHAKEYSLTTAISKSAVWNDEVYKMGQSIVMELLDYYDTQIQRDGYRINVYRKTGALIWTDAERIDFVWNNWTDRADDEGKYSFLDLVKGGMTSTGKVAEAVVCYQYGDTEYWVYIAKMN